MRKIKYMLCAVLTAALLLSVCALTAAQAYAAEYQDGDYTVPITLLTESKHNTVISPTTVHIENGNIYVDIAFQRKGENEMPQMASLTSDCGTYTKPEVNETNRSNTFYRVQVSSLGSVDVTVVTEAMSQPYEIDYTVFIDATSIPLKSESSPEPDPTPAPEPAPAPAPTPTPAPTPAPAPAPTPTPAPTPAPTPTPTPTPEPTPTDPVDPVEPAEPIEPAEPVDPNEPVSSEEPTEPDQPVEDEVIAPEPVPESVPVSPETLKYQDNHSPLSGGAIAAIVAGAVIVIGGVVWLILRNKKK